MSGNTKSIEFRAKRFICLKQRSDRLIGFDFDVVVDVVFCCFSDGRLGIIS